MRASDRSPNTRLAKAVMLAALLLPMLDPGHAMAQAHKGKVVIAQAVDAFSFLPMYVARAKGFWEQEGVDVEVRIVKGGSIAASAVVAGQAQVAATSADAPLLAARAGANILIVANILDKGPAEIVIHKSVLEKNSITLDQFEKMPFAERAKLFKGLRWGIIGPGGLTDLQVRASIKGGGWNPDRDTTIVNIGGSPELFAALNAGRIDGLVQNPPYTRQAVKEGFGVYVGTLFDVSPIFTDFAYEVLAVEGEWAKKNPDLARKVVRGMARANDYTRTTDAAVVAKEVHKFFPKIDLDILTASTRSQGRSVAAGARVTRKQMEAMVKFYIDGGTIKPSEAPKLDEGIFWTTEYLPK